MSLTDNAEYFGKKSQGLTARDKRRETLQIKAKEKRAEIILMLIASDYDFTTAYKKIYNANTKNSLYVGASKALNNPDMRAGLMDFIRELDRSLLSIEENINIEKLELKIINKENGIRRSSI